MRLFRCSCPTAPTLYFENVRCLHCQRMAGFCSDTLEMKTFDAVADAVADVVADAATDTVTGAVATTVTETVVDAAGQHYRCCANRTLHGACNWMVRIDDVHRPNNDSTPFCLACSMNDMIPDLSLPGNLPLWRSLEVAKRRCLFSLLELGLPVNDPSIPAMRYRFLANTPRDAPVLTGHDNGLITINLAEADDIERTRLQVELDEPYRTLLGHFRHECGHYYWDVFNRGDAEFAPRFRDCFGDERADYADALARHYQNSHGTHSESTSKAGVRRTHVSDYATMHPWEDWAESWAHYLHIIDAIETQQSLSTRTELISASVRDVRLPLKQGQLGARNANFDAIFALWMEASVVLNSLNRSMGLADPYPFVLHPPIKRKLRFIHDSIDAWQSRR